MEKSLVVTAPPGAGKTSFLLSRAEQALENVKPWERMLFLTFSRKAAREIRNRIPANKKDAMLSFTFHGFSLWLLRNYFSFFSRVISSEEKRQIIQTIQEELDGIVKTIDPETLDDYISFVKNTGVAPEQIYGSRSPYVLVLRKYQETLKRHDAVDFDDLIILAAEKLAESQDIKASLQERFRRVFVDEAQDMNRFQFELTRMIRGESITIVGDPNQSIYGWRGASPQFFRQIRGEIKNSLELKKNLRNPPSVFQMAEKVIPKEDRIKGIEFAKKDKPLSVMLVAAHGEEETTVLKKIAQKISPLWVLVRKRRTRDKLTSLLGAEGVLGRINVHTAHSAKGLEFPTVVIFSLKRGEFPPRGDDAIPSAEERRLLYVAITRTQERLIIIYDPVNPSPFVEMLGISG